MAVCTQCQHENAAGAESCEKCGAPFGVEVLSLLLGEVCRRCDSYNDPGTRMCVSCGHPLSAAPESAPGAGAPLEPAEIITAPRPVEKPATPAPRPVAPAGARAAPPAATPAPGPAARETAARAAGEASRCARCGVENPAGSRFCGACGLPMVRVGAAPRAKLIVVRGVGEGRQVPLSVPTTLGRGDAMLAFPSDRFLAPLHATVLMRGEEVFVRDAGSSNGVYVRLREPRSLQPGSMFVVGERVLRYAGQVPSTPQARSRPRAGAPRQTEWLHVVEEVLEGGGIGRVCRRPGPLLVVGRVGCDLNFPSDGFVSARHAELGVTPEGVVLRDLGSANGTFLRVARGAEQALLHGDYLVLGRELLRVELAGR